MIITDKAEIEKYLSASEEYYSSPPYTKMVYPFPNISESCPLCGSNDCAIWKGYYGKRVLCCELEFSGKVAIRIGYCKRHKKYFTLLPSFLLPFRKLSKPTLSKLWKNYQELRDVRKAADSISEDLPDEFYIPYSTLYDAFYFLIALLRSKERDYVYLENRVSVLLGITVFNWRNIVSERIKLPP